jgi:lysine 2,3-aminomutase
LEILKIRHRAHESWEDILCRGIRRPEELHQIKGVDKPAITAVTQKYPMFINPYFFNVIQSSEILLKQAIPDIREITDTMGYLDPLNEEGLSPVPGITHKYPERVLFLVSA